MATKKTKTKEPKAMWPQDLQDRDVKVHISIKLDFDVLNAARLNAEKAGMKYQTYINHLLRQVLIDEGDQSVMLDLKGLAILKEQVQAHVKKKKGA